MKVITALFLLATTSATCDTAGAPCVEALRNTGLFLEATASQIDYMLGQQASSIFNLKKYHQQGIRGQGVKIAILDSGLGQNYLESSDLLDAMNIVKVIDFTGEGHSNDQNGHGTFVAGMISSTNPDCFGFAPDAEIYILKLFTADDITFSSWFVDAFNWVLDNDIDIVNLSTASKDSKDIPFIDKLDELVAAGIIVVSAVGNDGPTQGSVENPGDLHTVIGVGSLSAQMDDVAYFSSRGMTKKKLLEGIGIPKPDLLLPGEGILGLSLDPNVCDMKQGTSFSVPIMTGSIALALSSLDNKIGRQSRKKIQNTALIRQSLIKSAHKLQKRSIVEQGSGRFSLDDFMHQIENLDELPHTLIYPY